MKRRFFPFFFTVLLFFPGCSDTPSNGTPDPLFTHQWHLENRGQSSGAATGGTAGEDLNTANLPESVQGSGTTVAVVDTGIEQAHPDLAAAIDTLYSATYFEGKVYSADSTPTAEGPTYQLDEEYGEPVDSAHGTACAGIVAAVRDNGTGVSGVAPKAHLVGLNVFADWTQGQYLSFADALYNPVRPVDVSSNSWTDNPGGLSDQSSEIAAIRNGIAYGRSGRGIVYCFAAGNYRTADLQKSENANWNRELNTPYVIAVAALNADGRYASYSNFGANILVSAFGGEYGVVWPAIVTTDLTGSYGYDDPGLSRAEQRHFAVTGNETGDYTHTMNGTSAATPMVAGVAALMLGANPGLTYRDIRYILATTARKNDPLHPGWMQNGAGLRVNPDYGFGAIDAQAAVEAAAAFAPLDANRTLSVSSGELNVELPDTGRIELTLAVSGTLIVEHAQLRLRLPHDYPGDLNITLISPAGTASQLSHTNTVLNALQPDYRGFFYDYNAHDGFTLGSVHFLDETAAGSWRLVIVDPVAHAVNTTRNDGGMLLDYTLILHGRAK